MALMNWDKWLGRTRSPHGKVSFPVQLDFPELRLRVGIYSHHLPTAQEPLPCWSYVTHGFEAWDQRELVLTVKREPGEPPELYPQDPIDVLTALGPVVTAEQKLGVGSYLFRAAGPGLFGAHVLCVDAIPLAGVDLPANALAGIAITDHELNTVKAFGLTRQMARLGREAQFYPCPVWSDRARLRRRQPSNEETMLGEMGVVSIPGLSVLYDTQTLAISATAQARADLKELREWSGEVVFAILTRIDRRANGCLVWEPGLRGMNAIVPPGSKANRLSGCFLMIVSPGPRNEFRIMEDGFALLLTPEASDSLRDALRNGVRLELATDGPTIVVEADKSAPRPTDGATIVLLHPDADMIARGLDAAVLSRYVEDVKHAMDDALLAGALVPEFRVFVAVRPGRESRAWGAPPDLRARLEAIRPPAVEGGPIAFAVQHCSPEAQLEIPVEWRTAVGELEAGRGTGASVDDVIARAW